jgi:hypothetical protein
VKAPADGYCYVCDTSYNRGEKVTWRKNWGHAHVRCDKETKHVGWRYATPGFDWSR